MGGFCDSAIKKVVHLVYYYLHKSSQPVPRWIGTAVFGMIYGIRVFYFLHGFYFITFLLVASILALFTAANSDDEFKPFIHELPEFSFWHGVNALVFIAFVITLFPVFAVADAFFNCGFVIHCLIIIFVTSLCSSIAGMINNNKCLTFTVPK